jgi:hypothetical protein
MNPRGSGFEKGQALPPSLETHLVYRELEFERQNGNSGLKRFSTVEAKWVANDRFR